MILLDTNVVSEAFHPRPNNNVRAWYNAQALASLYLCTPVIAELRFGAEVLDVGGRRRQLETLIRHIEEDVFRDRILPVDRTAAHEFGRLVARRKRTGRPIATMDAMIAAVAASHGMVVATRDISDFDSIGLESIDPFAANPA